MVNSTQNLPCGTETDQKFLATTCSSTCVTTFLSNFVIFVLKNDEISTIQIGIKLRIDPSPDQMLKKLLKGNY